MARTWPRSVGVLPAVDLSRAVDAREEGLPYAPGADDLPRTPRADDLLRTVDLPRAVRTSPRAESARRQPPRSRWLAGTAILVVGLSIGYASGIATAIWKPEIRNASRRSAASGLPVPAAQPSTGQSTADTLQTIPVPDTSSDTRRTNAATTRTSPPPSAGTLRRSTLQYASATAESQLGVLHVESRPRGAQVLLDDRPVATTPFRLYRVPLGSHTVRIELEGYKPFSTSVNLEKGTLPVRVAASLELDPYAGSQ